VWLEGRAFFGVEPDPSRTFTVRTQYGDAIALGTRFEVRTDEEEFRVLVVQGNVRVSSSGRSVELGEGLVSRTAQGAPPATSSVEDVDAELNWIGQTLVFRATPLSRVISEIEHRYGVTVELEVDGMRDLTVTAAFTDQPVESVLFVVCEIVGAGCTVEDGRFRIGDRSRGTLRPGTQPRGAPTPVP
jgi:transmembrane sensor